MMNLRSSSSSSGSSLYSLPDRGFKKVFMNILILSQDCPPQTHPSLRSRMGRRELLLRESIC
eukprot:8706400-Heterocapsa_arctica.AAC.1